MFGNQFASLNDFLVQGFSVNQSMYFHRIIFIGAVWMISMGTAQGAEQDPRIDKAKLACTAADVTQGIHLLAEIYTATQDPIWIYNQARCYQQNAQLDLALSRFKEYLRKSEGAPIEDIHDARKHIAEIEEEISQRPSIQGKASASPSTQVTNRPSSIQTPEYSPSGQVLRYAGISIGFLGTAALTTGVILSYLVRKTEKEVEQQAKDGMAPTNPNYQQYRDNLSNGPKLESWQWMAYGTGAVAVAVGGFLYWSGKISENQAEGTVSTTLLPFITTQGNGVIVEMSY